MAKSKKKNTAPLPTKSNKLFLLHQRYELKQVLVQDESSTLHLARDTQTRRVCMIREINLSKAKAWQYLTAFEKRAKTLSQLEHNALPRVIEYFTEETDTDVRLCVSLVHFKGESLRQQQRLWHERQLIDFALGLLDILLYLHSFSPPLIHGAICPDHVICQPDGRFVLIGMEVPQADVARPYQAPDKLKKGPGIAGDIYALGWTLIYALSGQEPIKERPSLPLKTSQKMSQILCKMIDKDVKKRYQTAIAVKHDLLQLQERLWQTAAQVSESLPLESSTKTVTWQPYWAASALTLLVIGGVAWGQRIPSPPSVPLATTTPFVGTVDPKQADNHWQQSNYRSARPLYAALVQQKPRDTEVLFRAAYCEMEAKDYDTAMALFQRILNQRDDFYRASAMYNMGWICYSQGKYAAALSWYQQVESYYTKDKRHKWLNNRGLVYAESGQYDLAIRDYQEAIRLKPGYHFLYNNLGWVYFKQNKLEQALQRFNHAIAMAPAYALPHFNKGEIYRTRQQWDLALEEYTTAITLAADYTDAYLSRARIYMNQHKYQAALTDLEQALKQEPKQGITHFLQGQAYQALKQCSQAKQAYQRACSAHYSKACQATCEAL